MTKEQAQRIIAVLSENWNVKFSALKTEIYGGNLADLDYQKCCIAVKKLIQTSEFLPTIAVLRKEYVNLGKDQIDASEAYALLKKTISSHGWYDFEGAMETLKQNNYALYELVRRIGWREICMCPESFLANQFTKAWHDLEQEQTGAISEKLLGKINSLKNEIQKAGINLLECED